MSTAAPHDPGGAVMTAPTPPHDVEWFLRERLPELAKMGTWTLTPNTHQQDATGSYIRLQGGQSERCNWACPLSAPRPGWGWYESMQEFSLSQNAATEIMMAGDGTKGHNPAIRAALLAGLGL